MKLEPGDVLQTRLITTVTGEPFRIPDRDLLVHLQFRRFVDCPICNTHIAEFRRYAGKIEAAGIKEVLIFHSSPESIRSYQKDLPFVMVGDPDRLLYKEFGVEASVRFLSFRVLMAALRGIARGHFGLRNSGKVMGLPADFLVAPSGKIIAAKYGTDAYDQWSAEELLSLAR
jgi:peroxiredoxin